MSVPPYLTLYLTQEVKRVGQSFDFTDLNLSNDVIGIPGRASPMARSYKRAELQAPRVHVNYQSNCSENYF